MSFLRNTVAALAYLSIGFSIAECYLTINKVWSRKHEQAVAESISVMGKLLGLIPLVMFSLDSLFAAQWRAIADNTVWIITSVVQLCIGLGFWVAASTEASLTARFKRALKLESTEVGNLARSFFRPAQADKILQLLQALAWLDDQLHPRERELIRTFAEAWGIDFEGRNYQRKASTAPSQRKADALLELRGHIEAYVSTRPGIEQALQLSDLVSLMVAADGKMTTTEQIIQDELCGLLHGYGGKGLPLKTFFSPLFRRIRSRNRQ